MSKELTAEEMFNGMYDIYLNLDGVDPIPTEARCMIFTLMESFATKRVREAIKEERKRV